MKHVVEINMKFVWMCIFPFNRYEIHVVGCVQEYEIFVSQYIV